MRSSAQLRAMCRETAPLQAAQLIMPYFVVETSTPTFCKEIPSMPGQFQLGLQALENKVAKAVDHGLAAVILFGIPAHKDEKASGAYAENGIIQQALRMLRQKFPHLLLITDVCLCEYMSHGHCGILRPNGVIDNDATLPFLTETAISYARAGADIIAPSDMMDGRIAAIRKGLDSNGFSQIPIMSYAVKYASAYYGPFRDAAESAPACGDRKSYQMDPANWREALLEAKADIEEGAAMLIVKPAGPYQDIIRYIRDNVQLPVAAYQVSGEYSLIRSAGLNGWLNEEAVMLESLIGIKRSGADIIITYFTETLLERRLAE